MHELQFANLNIRPNSNEIGVKGRFHKVDNKVMQLFVYLIGNSGKDLSKAEIMKNVWGENTFNEEVLTVAISNLRRVIGDDSKNPLYIKTIPRFGYRLLDPSDQINAAQKKRNKLIEYIEKHIGFKFGIISILILLFLLIILVQVLVEIFAILF